MEFSCVQVGGVFYNQNGVCHCCLVINVAENISNDVSSILHLAKLALGFANASSLNSSAHVYFKE